MSALERNDILPPKPGQLRRWVDREGLQQLLENNFDVLKLFSITLQFNRGFLRFVNSYKLRRLVEVAGCGGVIAQVKKWQEDAWLGWTLMALACKRVALRARDQVSVPTAPGKVVDYNPRI